MSLEDKIEKLTAAVEELTAAMGNGGAVVEKEEPAPPAKKAAPAKPAKRGAAKKTAPTQADARNAATKVQKAPGLGAKKVKEILAEFDGVKKLADLEEDEYAEFIEMCEEALDEASEEEDDEEDI